MTATEEYVRSKYQEFNRLFFEGRLPAVPIKLSRSRSALGQFRHDGTLCISTRFDLPENELEDVIIHEMIHCHIAVFGPRDRSAHGPVFRRMMQEINSRYGRHVSVSHRLTAEQREKLVDSRPRQHIVAVVSMKDGRCGIKVLPCTEKAVRRYRRGILLSRQAAGLEFFQTSDPYFNRYPSSSALRVYFMDADEIRERLADAAIYRL